LFVDSAQVLCTSLYFRYRNAHTATTITTKNNNKKLAHETRENNKERRE